MEKQYLDTLKKILSEGVVKSSGRPNMPDTVQIFGHQMKCDLAEGFPLYTTKEINFKHIIHELNWFIKGHTSVKYLEYHVARFWHDDSYGHYLNVTKSIVRGAKEYGTLSADTRISRNVGKVMRSSLFVTDGEDGFRPYTKAEYKQILRAWGDKWRKEGLSPMALDRIIMDNPIITHEFGTDAEFYDMIRDLTNNKYFKYDIGDCGAQYGYLWRNLTSITSNYKDFTRDQFGEVLQSLVQNPFGRRHIIDSWNSGTLEEMALNACHPLVQFDVHGKYGDMFIGTSFYMRSNDMFLGNPYNISFYALLTHILAAYTGYNVGTLTYSVGDCHIYSNHLDAVAEQVSRTPLPAPKFSFDMDMQDKLDLCTSEIQCFHTGQEIYIGLDNMVDRLYKGLTGYTPLERIKGELSTGN